MRRDEKSRGQYVIIERLNIVFLCKLLNLNTCCFSRSVLEALITLHYVHHMHIGVGKVYEKKKTTTTTTTTKLE